MKFLPLKKLTQITILAVLVISTWLVFSYQHALNMPLQLSNENARYKIEAGRSLSSVVYDLAKRGILQHPRYLLLYARLNGKAHSMKTGEYELSSAMTAEQLLENFFSGKVVQYSLTVVEGWTFQQMLSAIQQHDKLQKTLNALDNQTVMQALGYQDEHPEGRFLPDTYLFPAGLTDVEFLRRAYQAMSEYLQSAWQQRAVGLPYKTPYDALIMASIVEKETGLASEREAIAGVFVRRLEKRMRLQTDPTVIYGLGDKFNGNLRKRDLLREDPYNTYRIHGLPPTPIALPGKAAIQAAMHPADSDALYFVSRGDGSHVFSATLEEHNKAVIKYQLKGRARSFSSYKHKQEENDAAR